MPTPQGPHQQRHQFQTRIWTRNWSHSCTSNLTPSLQRPGSHLWNFARARPIPRMMDLVLLTPTTIRTLDNGLGPPPPNFNVESQILQVASSLQGHHFASSSFLKPRRVHKSCGDMSQCTSIGSADASISRRVECKGTCNQGNFLESFFFSR